MEAWVVFRRQDDQDARDCGSTSSTNETRGMPSGPKGCVGRLHAIYRGDFAHNHRQKQRQVTEVQGAKTQVKVKRLWPKTQV